MKRSSKNQYKQVPLKKLVQTCPDKQKILKIFKRSNLALKKTVQNEIKNDIELEIRKLKKEFYLFNYEPEYKKLKEENKRFITDYRSTKKYFKKEDTSKETFKDLVLKYKDKGYKIPDLSLKHNLFKLCPLIEGNSEKMTMAFESNDNSSKVVQNKSIYFLKKLSSTVEDKITQNFFSTGKHKKLKSEDLANKKNVKDKNNNNEQMSYFNFKEESNEILLEKIAKLVYLLDNNILEKVDALFGIQCSQELSPLSTPRVSRRNSTRTNHANKTERIINNNDSGNNLLINNIHLDEGNINFKNQISDFNENIEEMKNKPNFHKKMFNQTFCDRPIIRSKTKFSSEFHYRNMLSPQRMTDLKKTCISPQSQRKSQCIGNIKNIPKTQKRKLPFVPINKIKKFNLKLDLKDLPNKPKINSKIFNTNFDQIASPETRYTATNYSESKNPNAFSVNLESKFDNEYSLIEFAYNKFLEKNYPIVEKCLKILLKKFRAVDDEEKIDEYLNRITNQFDNKDIMKQILHIKQVIKNADIIKKNRIMKLVPNKKEKISPNIETLIKKERIINIMDQKFAKIITPNE